MISISSGFDGGNISVKDATNPAHISLEIVKDNQSDFFQWFYFRVTGAKKTACHFRLENAGSAAYPQGWNDYRAVGSYDREKWFRVPTLYKNGVLIINHTPENDQVYYAYFAPYSMERHADFIAQISQRPGVSLNVIGQTLDGLDMDLLTIGNEFGGTKKHQIWVTARQHPGETMAQWWTEGFLDRITDPADPVARKLLSKAVVHIVPNMNPDGSRRGHLRTNAAGVNLNREWDKASEKNSPEVFCVLNKMRETGVNMALDVHGDEALPYNFIAGAEGVPGFTEKDQAILDAYLDALKLASPDFQTQYGYPKNPPGSANLGICTNGIAHMFGCLAMTLEMPFKDTVETPDRIFGWSPARCKKMGAANLDAMLGVIDLIG